MKYIEYINQLNEMYDKTYNDSICGNRCPHWKKCKPDEPVKFCFDRVKVGEGYGTSHPKILFSGLEGKHGEVSDYRIPEIFKPSLDANNSHYIGVRYVLSYLLSKLSNQPAPTNADISELSADKFVEHLKHYCLTNIYKCAFGSPENSRGLTHTKTMKTECYKIFLKEIDILRPDFVVIQAVSEVPENLWKSMLVKYGRNYKLLKGDGQKNNTSAYQLHYEDGTLFYCIWSYHGSGRPHGIGKAFGDNNIDYIQNELNPILDKAIEAYKSNN